MIANTFALVIAMSISIASDIDYSTKLIPVEIDFCQFTTGEGESICNIYKAELDSTDKIFFDNNGQNPKLLIDKRNVTSDKMKYIFQNKYITVGRKNIINLPFRDKQLVINPGAYKIERNYKGYIISLTN